MADGAVDIEQGETPSSHPTGKTKVSKLVQKADDKAHKNITKLTE